MRVRRSVWTIISGCLIASCQRGPEPCLQLRHCDEGYECIASRCVPRGGDPVPKDSERRVLYPTRLGVQGPGAHDGRETVRLHGPAGQELELLMDFEVGEGREAHAAFLVLSAPPFAASSVEAAELKVERITAPWSEGSLRQGTSPERDPDYSQGLLGEGQRTRIDVTELMRRWLARPNDSHGFLVSSSTPSKLLIAIESGARGPYLELYSDAKGKHP